MKFIVLPVFFINFDFFSFFLDFAIDSFCHKVYSLKHQQRESEVDKKNKPL